MAEIIKGKGVFFHPPLSIVDTDEEPDLTQPESRKTRTVRFVQTKDNFQIIVTTDGFVGVTLGDSDDDILKLLNVFIATILTKGQRALFALDVDLCNFEYDHDKSKIIIQDAQVFSLRNRFEFERDNNDTYSLWAQTPRDKVFFKTMATYFDQAYAFYQNDELREYILLLGEAWGLSYEKLHKASFLYSWMIIETTIENYLTNHIESLSISEPEKKIIEKNTNQIAHSIKLLHDLQEMDEDTFTSIEKLRDKRNDLVHEFATQINYDDAFNCIHVANELIYNKFNLLPSPFVNIRFVR